MNQKILDINSYSSYQLVNTIDNQVILVNTNDIYIGKELKKMVFGKFMYVTF
jgi:hypothetical protein